MKRKLLRQIMILAMAALLAGSLASCGGEVTPVAAPASAEEDAPHTDGEETAAPDGAGEDWPDAAEPPSLDELWAAPTELGLADTVWTTADGWTMALFYDADAPETSAVSLSCADGRADADGVWRMEDGCLRLELDGGGAFPVLIAPSGETLRVFPDGDGARPPFLRSGADFAEMTLAVA